MRRLRRILGTAVVGLVAVSLVAPDMASADSGSDEMTFVAKLNELRASRGVGPLATRGDLFDLARAWSRQMTAVGSISHNPALSAQAPGDWGRLGENVGMGMDVQGLHNAFVNSPAHYRNMVDGAFDSVGVGVVRRGDGMIFVTVNFMTTRRSAPTAAPPAAPTAAPAAQGVKGAVCKTTKKGKVVCKAKAKAKGKSKAKSTRARRAAARRR